MVSENRTVADLRHRIWLHLRNSVFVDQAGRGIPRFEESLQFDVIESDEAQIA